MPPRKRNPGTRITAARIDVAERRAKALRMRHGDATYQQIADALNYHDRSHARRDIQEAMDDITADAVDQLRQESASRLATLRAAHWSTATDPSPADEKERAAKVAAAGVVMKVEDQLSKLYGLNAPLRQEVSGPEGGPVVVDAQATRGEAFAAILATQAARAEQSRT